MLLNLKIYILWNLDIFFLEDDVVKFNLSLYVFHLYYGTLYYIYINVHCSEDDVLKFNLSLYVVHLY